jgi:hypothetical protein
MTQAAAPSSAQQSVMPKVTFVDSRIALKAAYPEGLNTIAEIRSTAPSILLDPELQSFLRFRGCSPEDVSLQSSRTLDFCTDLFTRFESSVTFGNYAIVAAQQGLKFSTVVQKATLLQEEDFTRPVTIVRVQTGTRDSDSLTNMPWTDFLTGHSNLDVRNVDGSILPDINRRPPERTSFIDRQRLGGWEKIGYQIATGFWNRWPLPSPRGTFIILRENPLLTETVLSLARRGFGFKFISLPKPASMPDAPNTDLESLVAPAVKAYVSSFVARSVVSRLIAMFERNVRDAIARYEHSLEHWRTSLDRLAAHRPRAVLTNTFPRPEVAALHRLCRERALPMATFQHGVAREVAALHWNAQAIFEGNTSDVFYTYNDEAAAITRRGRFNLARTKVGGLPARYSRSGRYRRAKPNGIPILYASTSLLCGNLNLAAGIGTTDVDMVVAERRLIDEVFAKLPHKVLYKPYPNFRYLDDDPAVERARNIGNISVFTHRDDMSFLLPDCRVVVTARATSTFSWCATSSKPLVFIHYPNDRPLRLEIIRDLTKGFFLFDAGAKNFHDSLLRFLSQPLDKIERLWVDKDSHRAKVVRTYIGDTSLRAGPRIAHDLLSEELRPA